ncbi:MAG: hypothetical protein ACRCUT_05310 [Spirochaetota bacterium]
MKAEKSISLSAGWSALRDGPSHQQKEDRQQHKGLSAGHPINNIGPSKHKFTEIM